MREIIESAASAMDARKRKMNVRKRGELVLSVRKLSPVGNEQMYWATVR